MEAKPFTPETDRWPLTQGEMLAKLRCSDRTLRDWLRQLRIRFPGVSFHSGTTRHKLFEQKHYNLLIEYLPCLSAPMSLPVGKRTTSGGPSKPANGQDPFMRLQAFAQGRPAQSKRQTKSGSSAKQRSIAS